MSFLPSVTRAEHRGGYAIHLTFNDGLESVVDFSRWITGPVFEPTSRSRILPAILHRGRNHLLAERGGHRAGDAVRRGEVERGCLTWRCSGPASPAADRPLPWTVYEEKRAWAATIWRR
jgi:hypothetical protein